MAAGLGLLALVAQGCGDPSAARESTKIGLLLPFTGRAAGPSHNHERAVLLAQAQLGDVAGRPVEIVFGDTHSDLARGKAEAARMLDAGVVAIIAADTGELAQELLPVLRARNVLLVSPEIATSNEAASAAMPWFRLAPSARAMAESLARHLALVAGVTDVLILSTADGYNAQFARSFKERYLQLGGRAEELALPEDRRSYDEILPQLAGRAHVVLAARPETAARLVNEMWSFGTLPRWYLPPALRTDVFVRNASPQAVAGAIGVSPNVAIEPGFAAAFARHWDGDVVLESALFYYDAFALLGLGLARAAAAPGSPAATDSLAAGVFAAAFNRGIAAQWDELPAALADVSAGVVRYYRGVTGSIVLTADGQRGIGQEKVWTVTADGQIADLR